MKYRILTFLGALLLAAILDAQVPQILNYQGRVQVGTTNFDGTGQFKFALVNTNGTTTYWSNNSSSVNGSQPNAAVSLTVIQGLYSVLLGDIALTNMTTPVPPSVFNNPDVRLRVWFNDGTNGFQLLSPDQRLSSVGYSMIAENVKDGSITTAKIAPNAVTSGNIAVGAVSGSQIAANAVDFTRLSISGTPGSGQVLGFDGSSLSWTTPASGIWTLNNTSEPYYLPGRVGIGTSSQAAKLHIVSADGNLLRLDGANPHINLIDTANSNALTSIGGQAGSFYVTNNSTGVLMQITAAGFLGLGTGSPQSRLHLSGTANALRLTGPQPYLTLEDSATGFVPRIQNNGAGIDFKTNGAAINNHPGIIHLDGTGIVGLGTTVPKHQLSIRGFAGGPTWTSNGWTGAIDLDNGGAIGWATNTAGQRFGMGHSNGSFVMWRTAADPGSTSSPAIYDFTITDAGNIGIGTTAPQFPLDVNGSMHVGSYATGGTPKLISFGDLGYVSIGENTLDDQMELTAGRFVFNNGNVGIGAATTTAKLQVSSSGSVGAPQAQLTQTTSNDFARLRFSATGSPTTWDIAAGTTGGAMNFYAASTGRNVLSLNPNGTTSVQVLSITGGADLAEPFQMKEEALEKGSVVVIDQEHPGRLKRSFRAYDKRVAGIISGANGVNPGISLHQEGTIEGGQNVALTGRVYVRANAGGGAIEPGDLLTTSDVPGEAMKASDHDRAQGAIIGKAMSDLPGDSGHVLVLVTLQ